MGRFERVFALMICFAVSLMGCGGEPPGGGQDPASSEVAATSVQQARAAGFVTIASQDHCNNHVVQAYGATYCVTANIWTNNAGMAATSTDLYMFGGSQRSLDTWVSAYNGPNLNDNQRRAGLHDTNTLINGGAAIQENTTYYGPLDTFAIHHGDRLISNGGFEAGDNLTLSSASVQVNF